MNVSDAYVCGISGTKFCLRGKNVKPGKKFNFSEKG